MKSDAGGNDDFEATFDVRDDEQQLVKLNETIELLVAAGFFRARIRGLPVFDKVVGGMVWCIGHCNVQLDVDLLYTENSTLGQKISLTEKIVAVLPMMGCPHSLQPHQIQGLDHTHIFPVVQWLVKKAMEHRAQFGDASVAQGAWQFQQMYGGNNKSVRAKAEQKTHLLVQDLRERAAAPLRVFARKPEAAPITHPVDRVHLTLLENGERSNVPSAAVQSSSSMSQSQSSQSAPKSSDKGDSAEASTQETEQRLMGVLSESDQSSNAMSAEAVQMLLSEHQDTATVQVMHTDTHPHTHLRAAVQSGAESSVCEGESDDTQLLNLRIENVQKEIAQAVQLVADLKSHVQTQNEKLDESRDRLSQATAEADNLRELESQTDANVVQQLRELMNVHDQVKAAETAFKHSCNEEAAVLDAELARLQSVQRLGQDTTQGEIRDDHPSLRRLADTRLAFAALNKQIAALERTIDQVPSQAELNQYQRRFVELYNQMANKHRETKQFYALHNTLIDVKAYMHREIDLLESIFGVHQLASNATYKQSFVENLQRVQEGVRGNKLKVQKRLGESTQQRDAHKQTLGELHDKQRLYYKTVHDLQMEMKRNEQLNEQLAKLSGAAQGQTET